MRAFWIGLLVIVLLGIIGFEIMQFLMIYALDSEIEHLIGAP